MARRAAAKPLAQEPAVRELLSLMKQHNAPGQQDLLAMLGQIAGMEKQLAAAVEELTAMRKELAEPDEKPTNPAPTPEPDPEPEQPAKQSGSNMGTLLLVAAVVLLGGGAAWYFKIYRPKHQTAEAEEDYDEADFEDGGSLWDEDGEQESGDGEPEE